MKPNKPNFWLTIAALYFVVLCAIIVIYNIDFLGIKCLLLLPLYVPLIIALCIIHKNDEDYSNTHFATRWSLLLATAVLVVVKTVVDKIR